MDAPIVQDRRTIWFWVAKARAALQFAARSWNGMNLGMFISRRWRRSWRIPGRCRVRGVGQQPTKRDCTTNQERARNRAKTSLLSRKNFPALVRTLPVPRNETLCFRTGSGGRSTASDDLRGGPAPRRRPVGAAPVTPAGGCENCWRKLYSVLCLFLVPRESVVSHRLHRAPSPGNGSRRMLASRLVLREARFADPPARRGCEKEPALAPTV